MAYNNYQQFPFWDFVRALDNQHGPSGAGVDHPAEGFSFFGPHPHAGPRGHHQPPHGAGFPFGPAFMGRGGFGQGPCGRGGRGRHCRREGSHERNNPENPEGEDGEGWHGPRGFGRHGRGGHRGHHGGPGGRRGPPPAEGRPDAQGEFDLSALIESLSAHPLAEAFRGFAEQATGEAQRSGEPNAPDNTENDIENTFTPPIDVFSTEKQYVLHVAIPGARKEDVGVNWDDEKGVLNLAGVVYRQGDEEFLKTLTKSERKVGVFERTIKLPPGNEEKEIIDGDAITAKLEDGVLVVTVPRVEKEWTEVKRVDIN